MAKQRLAGRVTRFYPERGFGWIQTTDGGPDHFVHCQDAEGRKALDPGMRVSFIPTTTAKGPRALDVIIEDNTL